jgi:hypothetical protein
MQQQQPQQQQNKGPELKRRKQLKGTARSNPVCAHQQDDLPSKLPGPLSWGADGENLICNKHKKPPVRIRRAQQITVLNTFGKCLKKKTMASLSFCCIINCSDFSLE